MSRQAARSIGPAVPHYTVARLAKERWGVSPDHVYGLINRGELPVVRIGAAIRIPVETVERYEVEGPAPWKDETDQDEEDPDSKRRTSGSDGGATGKSSSSNGPKIVELSAGRRGKAIAEKLKRSTKAF